MQTTSPNIRAVAGRPEQAHSDNTSSRSPLATALTLAAHEPRLGVVQLDVTIVNTALEQHRPALGGGVAELQWVVNAYTIAFAALILTAGALGDRLGAKRIFMAASPCSRWPRSAARWRRMRTVLIGARAVQGLGRGDPGAELAGAAQPRLSGREGARPRGRHLGRPARASP